MPTLLQNFLIKSRACNSTNNNSIRVLLPLCTCSVYTLTVVDVQIITLETVEEGAKTRAILQSVTDTPTNGRTCM